MVGCHGSCQRPRDDPFEPNNTIAQARALERDVAVQARSVEGDPDVWTFTAAAGEHLTVEGTPSSQFYELLLRAPSGRVVLAQASGDPRPPPGDLPTPAGQDTAAN